jgi:hypothetical protein
MEGNRFVIMHLTSRFNRSIAGVHEDDREHRGDQALIWNALATLGHIRCWIQEPGRRESESA